MYRMMQSLEREPMTNGGWGKPEFHHLLYPQAETTSGMVMAGISDKEADYFVFKGKLKNQAYSKLSEPIRILKKDKTIEDVVEASDQLHLKALSKPVTKYFICFPKVVLEV